MLSSHKFLVTFLSIVFIITITLAQETCEAIVQQAIETTNDSCEGLRRNQACYGNSTVQVSTYGVQEEEFQLPGDMLNIAQIESLRLGAMGETDEWGIALLNIQASLEDDFPSDITMLLVGDTYVENKVKFYSELSISAINAVNLRRAAGTDFDLAGVLPSGESAIVDGRNSSGDWLRVQIDDGDSAWVFAPLVEVNGDALMLTVVPDTETIPPSFQAMQAFYLYSGVSDSPCREASESGLLIQTPEGEGTIEFLINEVSIRVGSTVFVQAQPGGFLTVSLLEGSTQVTSDGLSRTIPVGAQAQIPLDDSGIGSEPPLVGAYNPIAIEALPLDLLPRSVTLPDPLSDEDVNNRLRCTTFLREPNRPAFVGPGWNRGQLLELPFDTTFDVIGQASDEEGEIWYKLRPDSIRSGITHENIWVASSEVKSVGGCPGVPMAEIPPTVLFTDGPGSDVIPQSGTWTMTVLGAEGTGNCPLVPAGTQLPIIETPCYSNFIGGFNRNWAVNVAEDGLSMTMNGGFPYENVSLSRVSATTFVGAVPNTTYQFILRPISETQLSGTIENFSIRITVSMSYSG